MGERPRIKVSPLRKVPTRERGDRYIPLMARIEGDKLERCLPLSAFVTLTLPHQTSRSKLDTAFLRWIERVQGDNKLTLGWIKAYEPHPALHCHAVLLSASEVDCERACLRWHEIIGSRSRTSAKVEIFRSGIGGLPYVLKMLDRDAEDIQFSKNLTAFVPGAGRRFFGRRSTERRQLKRILVQLGAAKI